MMKIATPLIALAAAIVPDLGGRDGDCGAATPRPRRNSWSMRPADKRRERRNRTLEQAAKRTFQLRVRPLPDRG